MLCQELIKVIENEIFLELIKEIEKMNFLIKTNLESVANLGNECRDMA